MSRTFLDLFMDFTSEYESPASFWKWSAFSTIAAVLRDNVFLANQASGENVYANLFVILVAASGERKDPPISLAARLVTKFGNTKIIEGRSSIEAIIDELAHDESNHQGLMTAKEGSCLLAAPELSSFFVNSDSLVPLLTDMYAFREKFSSRLVSRSKSIVKRLCVTMLAASNEPLLKQIYSQLAMQGGLLARTVLVRPDEKRPPNALFLPTDEQPKESFSERQEKDLLKSLGEISKHRGMPQIDKTGAIEYVKWYNGLYNANHRIDPSGIMNRIHVVVKKMTLILAANAGTFRIGKQEVEQAIDECTKLLGNYMGFTMGSGQSTIQEAGTIFLNDLWSARDHKVSRRDILMHHWGVMDAETLDKLVATLEQAGMIKVYIDNTNTTYTATERCLEILSKGKGK